MRIMQSCGDPAFRTSSDKTQGNSLFITVGFLIFFSFFLAACTQDAESILDGINEGILHVCSSGCEYASISPAIAAASDDYTIKVHAGTYSETLDLAGKTLTIEGAGVGLTIIDASSSDFYDPVKPGQHHSIQDFGNNSVIRGVSLIGNSEPSMAHYGFKVSHVNNITLENIRVQDSYHNGVDLNTVNNATLNNIQVTDTVSGFGIMMLDSQNITVTNVTTNNNAWGGVSIQTKDASSDNIRLLGTFDANDTIPLLVEQDPPYGLISNVQLPDKFGWVAYGFRDGSNYRQWFYQETQTDAVAFVAALDASTLPDPTYSSTNSYSTPGDRINHYPGVTVQPAIDAASNGDVIHVSSGTFDGVVDIDKRIILQGVGSEDDGTVLTLVTPSKVVPVTGSTYGYSPIVIISASGIDGSPVLLKDLRIEPRQDEIGTGELPGIFFRPGSAADNFIASYEYLALDNIRVIGTSSPDTPESGMTIDGRTSVDNLAINDCEFRNMAYGMIFYNNGDFPSTVEHIQVSDTIFDNNSIKGFYTEKLSYATFNNVTATNNGNTALSPSWADAWNEGIEVNLKYGAYSNLAFNNLTVTGNGIGSSNGVGLSVKARGTGSDSDGTADPNTDYGVHQASLTGVTVSGGTFTGNETGIRFGEVGKDNTYPTVISVSGATISGNNQIGLVNELDGVSVDATTGNTWGNSPPNEGDDYSGDVAF